MAPRLLSNQWGLRGGAKTKNKRYTDLKKSSSTSTLYNQTVTMIEMNIELSTKIVKFMTMGSVFRL